MVKIKVNLALMYMGMLLALMGGVLFLFFTLHGQMKQETMASMICWGCGSAAMIFLSAKSAIRKLKQRRAG